MVKKRPSLQQLYFPSFLLSRRTSEVDLHAIHNNTASRSVTLSPSSAASYTSPTSDSSGEDGMGYGGNIGVTGYELGNSDLLDNDPFAAPDRSSYAYMPSATSSASGQSTPSLTSSIRSLSSTEEEKNEGDALTGGEGGACAADVEEDIIKVEPLHRKPLTPSHSLVRRPSGLSLRGSTRHLPCLQELETRLVTVTDVGPRSAAKAKAKHLPFEPWSTITDSDADAGNATESAPSSPSSTLEHTTIGAVVDAPLCIPDLPQPPTPASSSKLTSTPPSMEKSLPLIPADLAERNSSADSLSSDSSASSSSTVTPQASPSDEPAGPGRKSEMLDWTAIPTPYQYLLDNDSQRTVGSVIGGPGLTTAAGGATAAVPEAGDTVTTVAEVTKSASSSTDSSSSGSLSDSDEDVFEFENFLRMASTDSATSSDSYGDEFPHTPILEQIPELLSDPFAFSSTAGRSGHHKSDSDDQTPLAIALPTALESQKTIRKHLHHDRTSWDRVFPSAANLKVSTAGSHPESVVAEELSRKLREVQKALDLDDKETLLAYRRSSNSPPLSPSQQPTIRPPRTSSRPSVLPHQNILPVMKTRPRTLSRSPSADLLPSVQEHPELQRIRPTLSARGSYFSGQGDVPPSAFRSRISAPLVDLSSPPVPQTKLRRATTSIHLLKGDNAPKPPRSLTPSHPHARTPAPSPRSSVAINTSPVPDGYATVRARQRSSSLSRASVRQSQSRDHFTPPVPPLPSALSPTKPNHPQSSYSIQQRIFIINSQNSTTIYMDETTQAADVLEIVIAKGDMICESGGVPSSSVVGEWMLWEVCNECALERPIRPMERLIDITTSWSLDKRLNTFMLKKTNSNSFHFSSGVAPTHSGYVDWESAPGKWSKRWMELRDGSLFLSKKDNSKEVSLHWSLSNVDVYMMMPRHLKSAREFTFAVKSTRNESLFENQQDYLNLFACDKKTGHDWVKTIYQARSSLIQLERSKRKSAQPPRLPTTANSTPFSKKKPIALPLVSLGSSSSSPLSPSPSSATRGFVFEPGSLLAKQAL